MKNQVRMILVVLILLAVFSAAAFLLPVSHTPVFWVSYCVGVFAIVIQLFVQPYALGKGKDAKSKFYGFPLAKNAVVYMVVQVVLSLLFIVLSSTAPLWLAGLLYILLFAAAALGLIAADTMRDEIVRQDNKLKSDISCMTTLRSIVYPLADQCSDPEAKKNLQKLADEFRYSDPVSSGSLKAIESELETRMAALQMAVSEGDTEKINSLCREISITLTERNRLCKLNK